MAASSFFETKAGQNCIKAEDFELSVLVNDQPRDIFVLNNIPNIVPEVGEEFQVKFTNNSDKAVMANLMIDGVEVLGKGWNAIVSPTADYTFKGFSRDDNRVAAFLFAPLDKEAGPYTSKDANTVPDSRIGLISCHVYDCICVGTRDSFSYTAQPVVNKNNQAVSKNKKKANVITGSGTVYKDHTSVSKEQYQKQGMIGCMEIRYNAIGAPIPMAELDSEFMDGVDYE